MTAYWNELPPLSYPKFAEKIQRLIEQSPSLFIRTSDGLVDYRADEIGTFAPWIFVNPKTTRHCALWNQIYFHQFDLIPSFCRYCCWKIVVKPSTLRGLFTLLAMLRANRWHSKCGLDQRDYSPGPYAGFIYNDSLEEGQRRLDEVKREMPRWFSKKQMPDVFLKRGCTEMELRYPSDTWDEMTDAQMQLEKMLDEVFVKHEKNGQMSDWLCQGRYNQWIRHAIMIGDPTWREYVDDPSVYVPKVVRYDSIEEFRRTRTINSDQPMENL